jgi:DNA segregation ATPase FtsK/SpoIIIE-like protein
MATKTILDETTLALERIQNIEVSSLGREDDLGKQMSFSEAITSAGEIVDLYKRISLNALNDFSDTQLNAIKAQAQADFNIFQQILSFDATVSNAATIRTQIITAMKARRDQLFDQIWQYIAYGVARNTDASLLEVQARSTIQSIKDQAATLTTQLNNARTDADKALEAIRLVAAEQGVSQQASYFKTEAEAQESLAEKWLKRTYWSAAGVGVFAILSLFLHKWEWIKPVDTPEMMQLISSKILIFAVLGYLLLLASRNYTTHKHNAVVNRHRQNALLTYQALVEAAGEDGTQDIVLAHASSCIFSPQETGFSNSKNDSSGSKSILELMTKATKTNE